MKRDNPGFISCRHILISFEDWWHLNHPGLTPHVLCFLSNSSLWFLAVLSSDREWSGAGGWASAAAVLSGTLRSSRHLPACLSHLYSVRKLAKGATVITPGSAACADERHEVTSCASVTCSDCLSDAFYHTSLNGEKLFRGFKIQTFKPKEVCIWIYSTEWKHA